MHFYDDGLFVGQFGTPGRKDDGGFWPAGEVVAGFAGNSWSPELVSVNGELYLWQNDESGHGPQRWHVTGINSLREFEGTTKIGKGVVLRRIDCP